MELSLFAKGYLEGYINGASDHGGIVVHEDSVTLPDGVFYPSEKTVTRSLTKLDNLENIVIAGLRAIKEKQVSLGAEFVVLYGEEGQILHDLCELVASEDGDPEFLKYDGALFFEKAHVVCR